MKPLTVLLAGLIVAALAWYFWTRPENVSHKLSFDVPGESLTPGSVNGLLNGGKVMDEKPMYDLGLRTWGDGGLFRRVNL